ncbi:AAA family ATPase [Streptosporangium canum]|uniref:AAA family ATPase n=1 Tax=Streptosporangium canum TaxID=324952 RepID=UPI003673BF95
MDGLLADTPALLRLRWLLQGLDGRWAAQPDVAGVLAPDFATRVTPDLLLDVTQTRAQRFAPIRVVGIDADGQTATARFRTRDNDLWVSHVEVESAPPHRITLTHTQRWVPDYLIPPLPADFTGTPMPAADGALLIVFSGVPGSGKSAVAERVGAALGIAVFAMDWLLGALTPFGIRHRHDLTDLGNELLTTLAYRELAAQRSAILDTTSEDPAARDRWTSLAAAAAATFIPVVCICTDEALHRQRVEHRTRAIPGWADAGEWANTRARLAAFPPWPGAVLIDTVRPLDECVAAVLTRIPRHAAAEHPDMADGNHFDAGEQPGGEALAGREGV